MITIDFTDFDTMCYSSQHNIIQLIEKCVGIGIEINIVINDVQAAKDKADQAFEQAGLTQNSLVLTNNRVDRLNEDIENTNKLISALEGGWSTDFDALRERVRILEEKVGV